MPTLKTGLQYTVKSGPYYISLECDGVYLGEINVFAVAEEETPDEITLIVAQTDMDDALNDPVIELCREMGSPMQREIARQVHAKAPWEKIRVDIDCHLAAHQQDRRDYARAEYLERQWDDRRASF